MVQEKGKRMKFEDRSRNLLSEMTTLRIGSRLGSDSFVFPPPTRHERTVPRTTITSQSIPFGLQFSSLRSKATEKLNRKNLREIS